MFYSDYYWGMNIVWWIIWFILIFWIFATPYYIPGQRRIKDLPLEILKRRYAKDHITKEEYEKRKKILEE